jgi:hypothetical protein
MAMNDQTVSQMLDQEMDEVERWVGQDGVVYARFELENQRVTYPVQSRTFRMWLDQKAMEAALPLPSSRIVSHILAKLQCEANAGTDRYPVSRRVYNDEDCTYLNLGAEQILTVSADGCEFVGERGPIFPTEPNMIALPAPVKEPNVLGTLSKLYDLDEHQTLLVLAWLIASFQADGRVPPLIVTGAPKSGKSRLAIDIRQLIDPAQVPLLAFPHKPSDFIALAASNSVLAFDNVRKVPQACRDAIIALAEGTASCDRRTGTTSKYKVPTILVCEDLCSAGELARDAIVVRLRGREVRKMKSKTILDKEFNAAHARALGALVGLAVRTKASDETVELNTIFKDAALERWLLAVDKVLAASGKLMQAYHQNGQAVLSDIVSDNPALSAFMGMVRARGGATATAMDMMSLIEPFLTGPKGSHWPKGPKEFATLLRNSVYAMPDVEIEFDVRTGKERHRMIVASLKVQKKEGKSAPPAARPAGVRKKVPEDVGQPCLI